MVNVDNLQRASAPALLWRSGLRSHVPRWEDASPDMFGWAKYQRRNYRSCRATDRSDVSPER